MRKLVGPLLFCFLSSSSWAGATFSRVKTWTSGETLTASDLNAEFNNILNNLTTGGVDDYSANTTEMRTVSDPYPGSSESLATSLQGELERIRYQILEIKKSMQASNITYWYQDLPTAGVFTVAGSSVGVNDTTPDYALDVAGTLGVDHQITASSHVVVSGNITSDGNITTTGDDVDITTHVAITGNLTVGGSTNFSLPAARAYAAGQTVPTATNTKITLSSEEYDIQGNFDSTTNYRFTAPSDGRYIACGNVRWASPASGDYSIFIFVDGVNKGGSQHELSSVTSKDISYCSVFNLSASSYLELYVRQESGGDEATAGGAVTATVFSVNKLF